MDGGRQSTEQSEMPIVNNEIQQSRPKKKILQLIPNWPFHTSVNMILLYQDG